jgi:hypothetical protein
VGILDKAIAAADQASTRVKEGVDDVQDKRLLSQAYEQLGRTAYELIEKDELTHEGLTAQAGEIRVVREHLGDEEKPAASSGPPTNAPPPATPT